MSNKSAEDSGPDTPEAPTPSDSSSTKPMYYTVVDGPQQRWAWLDEPMNASSTDNRAFILDERTYREALETITARKISGSGNIIGQILGDEPMKLQEVKWERVAWGDVREGDFIGCDYEQNGRKRASWNLTVVRKGGKMGFMQDQWPVPGSGGERQRFVEFKVPPNTHVDVRLPRPPAPVNEFGPVSP